MTFHRELHNIIYTDKRNKLPEDEASFYIAGIAEGLGYMHRKGTLHDHVYAFVAPRRSAYPNISVCCTRTGYIYRDLKPENVLINGEGYPVVSF